MAQKGFSAILLLVIIVLGICISIFLAQNHWKSKPNMETATPANIETQPNYESKTAVVLFKFQNSQTPTLTKKEVGERMFTNPDSVNSYYQANSNGRVIVTGEIYDWITLPINVSESDKCEADNWVDRANKILKIDPSSYKNFVYIWSANIKDCGIAFVAGNKMGVNGESWVKTTVILHEFGHLVSPRANDPSSVGVNHASFYRCPDSAITPLCTIEEYGDRYTRMGSPNLFNFTGIHQLALGWLPSSAVQEITQSGIYKISVLGSDTDPRLLKIRKADTNPPQYYYLEYRKNIRFRPDQPDNHPILLDKIENGAVIRLWDERPENNTLLIDTTPETPTPPNNESAENADEALSDGATFFDQYKNLKITQVSHDDSSATLEISMPKNTIN